MGGPWSGSPAVGTTADGRLEVYMRGQDRQLYHNWQATPNAAFGGWHCLGGAWASDAAPTVARHADGRLAVFMRGQDGALYGAAQATPNGDFGPWSSLGRR